MCFVWTKSLIEKKWQILPDSNQLLLLCHPLSSPHPPCLSFLQLAMVRTPSVKAARCAPGITAVWTASPNCSCFCGGRGWGSMGSVFTTVRPDTTACAAPNSTCAPVRSYRVLPTQHPSYTPPSLPKISFHPRLPSQTYNTTSHFPTANDLLRLTQRRRTCLTIWTAHPFTQVDVTGEALS